MTLTQKQMRMIPQLKTELTYSKVEHLLSAYYEDQLTKEVSKIFQEMEYRVINNLAEYYNPEVMFKAHTDLILSPIHEMHKQYYELLCKYKIREFDKSRAAGKRIVERLINFRRRGNILSKQYTVLKADLNDAVSSTITKDKLFGTSPDVHENLETRTYQLSEKTLARVDGQINDIIVKGYEEGMGIDKVSRDIRRRFGQLKTWESVRIARTEIHNSQCLGVIKGYEDMGVEYIQWSTARDSRVRGLRPKDSADHIHMEGEIIRMGGVFSNGLMYPGDMNGPAAEIINCRCQALPFIIPYGYIAPSFSPFREDDLIPIETTVEPTTPESVEPQISDELLKEKLTDKEYKQYNGFNRQIEDSKAWLENHPDATEKQVTQINKTIQEKLDKIKKLEEKALGIEKQVSESVQINANAPSPVSPLEGYSMDTLKKDIPIEDKTFDKMMNWSYKRATKNKIEYGYQFDTSTGKLIGDEVRGKKGSVTFTQQGETIGSMHTHPPVEGDVGGGSFPSKQDLKVYRSQKGADHLIGSPTEVWYVHAEENLNSSVLGQREIDAIYNKVYKETTEKGQELVKQGKLKTDDKSLRKFLDKEIGDGLLREFNTREWQEKGFYIRRAYR